MSVYKNVFRPWLFRGDPEARHGRVLRWMASPSFRYLRGLFSFENKKLGTEPFRYPFSYFQNPIGLAAGFDKNAVGLYGADVLGFGSVEIGTVTPRAQDGNPLPRIFRLPEDGAIINRMGFPGLGMQTVRSNLNIGKLELPQNSKMQIGINIGPNKETVERGDVASDIKICMENLWHLGDYFTVNLSSPNTPGLRDLQIGGTLDSLLSQIKMFQVRMSKDSMSGYRPVLVKVSPDLSKEDRENFAAAILHHSLDGIIATNTSVLRTGLQSRYRDETGGLSGEPIRLLSRETVRHFAKLTKGSIPIVAVGGISTVRHAIDVFEAGASLVQIYTGLIYEGPFIVKNLNVGIARYLDRYNYRSINDLIGRNV